MASNTFSHPFPRFCAISVALFLVLFMLPESSFVPLNRVTATLSGWCIGLFGMHAEAAGDIITLNGFRFRIITECTALYSMTVFAAFVFAWPAPWRQRLWGLLAGCAVLNAVNLVRIAMVTVVGTEYPRFFEAVHVYLGQVAMLLLVIGLAMVWLRWVSFTDGGRERFILRAAVLASLLFPLWLVLNTHYVRMLDRLVTGLFSLKDYSLVIDYQHAVYFQTFNVVLLAALLLAEQGLDPRGKLLWIVAGTTILGAGHVLFRVGNVLLVAFDWKSALGVTTVLTIMGEYLLPVILWLAASAGFSVKRWRVDMDCAKGLPQILFMVSCGLIALLPHDAAATSIVCLRTPDSVYIAADSMMTAKNSAGESFLRECKIHRTGDIVFALAGFYKDPFRRYDLRELVAGNIGKGVAVTEAGDAIVNAVSAALREELARLRSEAPELYNKHIKGKTAPLVRILLARHEEGVPKVLLLTLRPVVTPSAEIVIRADRTVCPGDCNSQSVTAFFLTERTAIDAYLKQGGKLDWSSPENAAKKMVELVMAARAPGVGPPVDVLRIDAGGVQWVELKPECPDYGESEWFSPVPTSGPPPDAPPRY